MRASKVGRASKNEGIYLQTPEESPGSWNIMKSFRFPSLGSIYPNWITYCCTGQWDSREILWGCLMASSAESHRAVRVIHVWSSTCFHPVSRCHQTRETALGLPGRNCLMEALLLSQDAEGKWVLRQFSCLSAPEFPNHQPGPHYCPSKGKRQAGAKQLFKHQKSRSHLLSQLKHLKTSWLLQEIPFLNLIFWLEITPERRGTPHVSQFYKGLNNLRNGWKGARADFSLSVQLKVSRWKITLAVHFGDALD